MDFGREIKRLRKARGYTQEQLGTMLGVQKSAVQKYEKGTVKNLKPEIISKLCQIFDVSPSLFFDVMYDGDKLNREVELLDELSAMFGFEAVDMLESFEKLNFDGKNKLVAYAKDLAEITKYTT